MGAQREAWETVGDRFSSLTSRFKEKYEARDEVPPEEAADQLKGAVRSIIDAIDGAATTLNEMARDPETREDARSTMLALRDALNTSFTELGDEMRKRMGGKPGEGPADGPEEPPERDPVDED